MDLFVPQSISLMILMQSGSVSKSLTDMPSMLYEGFLFAAGMMVAEEGALTRTSWLRVRMPRDSTRSPEWECEEASYVDVGREGGVVYIGFTMQV